MFGKVQRYTHSNKTRIFLEQIHKYIGSTVNGSNGWVVHAALFEINIAPPFTCNVVGSSSTFKGAMCNVINKPKITQLIKKYNWRRPFCCSPMEMCVYVQRGISETYPCQFSKCRICVCRVQCAVMPCAMCRGAVVPLCSCAVVSDACVAM